MRKLILALLFTTPLFAAPAITSIEPKFGFTFASTYVVLRGTDLGGPAEVFFGSEPGTVLATSATHIEVQAPPQAKGKVDIRVRVEGKGEVTLPNAFEYTAFGTATRRDYEAYLVPILARATDGGFGSRWRAEFSMFSPATDFVAIAPLACDLLVSPCPNPPLVLPRGQVVRDIVFSQRFPLDGAYLYIPKALVPLPMTLHVRDLSRNAETAGTQIDVPPLSSFRHAVHLVQVPVEPQHRLTLRIYSASQAPMPVRVSIHPEVGGGTIEEYDVQLEGIVNVAETPFPLHPAYVQLDPLSAAVRAAGVDRIRITVTVPNVDIVSPPLPQIWAMVSITNNDTQQVTMVVPAR